MGNIVSNVYIPQATIREIGIIDGLAEEVITVVRRLRFDFFDAAVIGQPITVVPHFLPNPVPLMLLDVARCRPHSPIITLHRPQSPANPPLLNLACRQLTTQQLHPRPATSIRADATINDLILC
ncbi:hypothetical protein Aduo_007136 [Ancylostoma duodenale]